MWLQMTLPSPHWSVTSRPFRYQRAVQGSQLSTRHTASLTLHVDSAQRSSSHSPLGHMTGGAGQGCRMYRDNVKTMTHDATLSHGQSYIYIWKLVARNKLAAASCVVGVRKETQSRLS